MTRDLHDEDLGHVAGGGQEQRFTPNGPDRQTSGLEDEANVGSGRGENDDEDQDIGTD